MYASRYHCERKVEDLCHFWRESVYLTDFVCCMISGKWFHNVVVKENNDCLYISDLCFGTCCWRLEFQERKKNRQTDRIIRDFLLRQYLDKNQERESSIKTCKQPCSATKAILGKSLFLPAFQLLSFHILSVTFFTQNIKQDKIFIIRHLGSRDSPVRALNSWLKGWEFESCQEHFLLQSQFSVPLFWYPCHFGVTTTTNCSSSRAFCSRVDTHLLKLPTYKWRMKGDSAFSYCCVCLCVQWVGGG